MTLPSSYWYLQVSLDSIYEFDVPIEKNVLVYRTLILSVWPNTLTGST